MDASVTVAWCFPEQVTPFSERLLESLRTQEAVVPTIWPFEIANVLARAARKERITSDDVDIIRAKLRRLAIHVDATGHVRALDEVLSIATAHQITVYGAAYLELALRESIPLATLDDSLRRAAGEMRVPLMEE